MSTHDLFEQRKNFFLAPSQLVRGGLFLALVLGATLLGMGFMHDPVRAWGAYLFNLFFFFTIALGGVVLCGMQDIVGAIWGRPVRRIHEAFSSFLPLAGVLFVVFFACIYLNVGGAGQVYKWIADPKIIENLPGKRQWLQMVPMLARDTFAIILIVALALWQMRLGLNRDKAFVDGHHAESLELGKAVRSKLQYWSAPILVCYAITFSMLGFDLMMSLSPKWSSTLFGGWLFAIMMQTTFATLLLTMFGLKSSALGQVVGQQQFHDVGKLMHGFTIFFAYLTYAHVLTYWYGNMPEETEYYMHRMHAPWLYLIIGAPLLNFVLPLFAMIPKASKWTATIAVPIGLLILFGQWVVYLIVVTPEIVEAHDFHFPWVELGGFCGMLALFGICALTFAKRNPMLPFADPLLADALRGGQH